MSSKPIHLPYNQYDNYWVCVLPKEEIFDQQIKNTLTTLGFSERKAQQDYFIASAGKHWGELWKKFEQALSESFTDINIAIIAGEKEPEQAQVSFSHKPAKLISKIVDSLWLGQAILADELTCHLQPDISKDGRTLGHESFVRVVKSDGQVIGGKAIVAASRELGIEYALDRYLHVLAIKTFMSGGLDGYLFVNFFPGFIQRPEVYLEGLTDAVKMHNMLSKHVVLDFTDAEHQEDMAHLKKVTDFCRTKGYAIALDDVESLASAKKLIPDIKPDFVKLSRSSTSQTKRADDLSAIRNIAELAHANGSMVIAEGVEDKETHEALKQVDIDMFQGFLFSEAVEIKPAGSEAATGS